MNAKSVSKIRVLFLCTICWFSVFGTCAAQIHAGLNGKTWISKSCIMEETYELEPEEYFNIGVAGVTFHAIAKIDSHTMLLYILDSGYVSSELVFNLPFSMDTIYAEAIDKGELVSWVGTVVGDEILFIERPSDSFMYITTFIEMPGSWLASDELDSLTISEQIINHKWQLTHTVSNSKGIIEFRKNGVFEYVDLTFDNTTFRGEWGFLEIFGQLFMYDYFHTDLPAEFYYHAFEGINDKALYGSVWTSEGVFQFRFDLVP